MGDASASAAADVGAPAAEEHPMPVEVREFVELVRACVRACVRAPFRGQADGCWRAGGRDYYGG
jgi:hypothetical protein